MRLQERLGSLELLVGTDINRDKGDNKTSPRGVKEYKVGMLFVWGVGKSIWVP